MKLVDRRTFLVSAAGGVASRAVGANDRVHVAVIGVRSRGREHINLFTKDPGSRVVAVCDVDLREAERAAAFDSTRVRRPRIYQDLRRLLEDRDVDAVSIATCNHWHALATIWACQAGKDVYVEKPASHNVWEGRQMVEAARRYGRVVQVGMQGRSIEHKKRAIERLREGAIGQVYLAKGVCFKRRRSIGRGEVGAIPAGVDYDLWRGPAPMRPFNENRFHYNWHWFWDTGNGEIGNQGVHEMDIARWGLGKTALPRRVLSSGGKFVYDDDQETPNTQLATFDYGDSQIVFEVRGLPTGGEGSLFFDGTNSIGTIFLGSEGFMSVDGQGFSTYNEKHDLIERMDFTEPRSGDAAPHVASFLDAVRSRNRSDLTADIEEGHLSAALCHLANISYRLGRALDFDPQTETFPGDEEANRYLSRDYREPFTVPAKV